MKVTYISACLDSSGYAEAARNNIAALDLAGVDLAVKPVTFEGKKANHGKLGNLIKRLSKKPTDGQIQILHLTPQHFPQLVKNDKYNIGYTTWEASLLPSDWVPMINVLNEVWVPSMHNKKCLEDSGVTIPIFCMPHTFCFEDISTGHTVLENKNSTDFTFYSIFQWLERKNPVGLIRAYLTEFKPSENVVLVLKTFVTNPGSPKETESIKERIRMIKKTLYLKEYPRMLLISNLLSREQMMSLHYEGDCYISLPRCEGFGIPFAEAMQAGNPVIATGYGGPVDFIQHSKTGYLVDYMMTPVANMPWEMYTGYMQWAEPNLMQTREYMRTIFEDQKKAAQMGKRAKKWIETNLSWEALGQKMKTRLEEINLASIGV